MKKYKNELLLNAALKEYKEVNEKAQKYLKLYRETGDERYYTLYSGHSFGTLSLKWKLNSKFKLNDSEIKTLTGYN